MINRWGLNLKRGQMVRFSNARGTGQDTGRITRFSQMPAYGWRAEIDNGGTVSVDDIVLILPRVDVVVKQLSPSAPELFFVNSNSRGDKWIEGYSMRDGHFEPGQRYYKKCQTLSADNPVAIRLAQYWESIGPKRHDVRIVKRLRRGPAA